MSEITEVDLLSANNRLLTKCVLQLRQEVKELKAENERFKEELKRMQRMTGVRSIKKAEESDER